MHPELAALHTALEPLADPITPWPTARPSRLYALGFLRGLTMAAVVRARAFGPIRRRSGFGKPRRKA